MMTMVLPTEASTIGTHWSASSPIQLIMPTPAGTKKNPRLWTRNADSLSTHWIFTTPAFNATVRLIMPMMLEGSGTPVKATTSSPKARKPKIIPN